MERYAGQLGQATSTSPLSGHYRAGTQPMADVPDSIGVRLDDLGRSLNVLEEEVEQLSVMLTTVLKPYPTQGNKGNGEAKATRSKVSQDVGHASERVRAIAGVVRELREALDL